MKPSGQDIHTAYVQFEQLLAQYAGTPKASESKILIRDFQGRALEVLTNLAEIVVQQRVVHSHGQVAEDRMQAALERFVRRYGNALEIPLPSPIPSIDDLLSRINAVIAQLMEQDILRVPFRIYPIRPDSSPAGIIPWNGQWIDPIQIAPKYSILIDILLRHGIDPAHDISVVQETLSDNQMRSIPYRIIYVRLPFGIRTICISDEVGEQTYVYAGMVDLVMWSESEKGKSIGGIATHGVRYGDRYADELERTIFEAWKTPENQPIQDNPETIETTISPKESLSHILLWQLELIEAREILAEAGIIYEGGAWYFGDAKWMDSWKNVREKGLRSFPNAAFNKENGIGNERWIINNSQELSKMFATLGLRVATDVEQRRRWARMIEAEKAELEKVGIVCENGIWYFRDAKWWPKWPKIWEKGSQCFPNVVFNKENGIGNERWAILNPQELSKMFSALGLRVATLVEENARKVR